MSNATEGMGDVPLFINRGARNRPRFQKLDADEAIWKCASKLQNPRVGNVRGNGQNDRALRKQATDRQTFLVEGLRVGANATVTL